MSSWLVPVFAAAVVLSCAAITSSFSIHSNDLQRCYPAHIDASTVTMLLNSDDSSSSSSRDVFRVIAPDNIASLFGSASSAAARSSKLSSLNKPSNTSAAADSRSDTSIDDEEEVEIPFEIGIAQLMRNDFKVEMLSSKDDGAVDTAELNNLMPVSVVVDLADEEAAASGDPEDYGDLTGSLDTVSAVRSSWILSPSHTYID